MTAWKCWRIPEFFFFVLENSCYNLLGGEGGHVITWREGRVVRGDWLERVGKAKFPTTCLSSVPVDFSELRAGTYQFRVDLQWRQWYSSVVESVV